MRHSDISLYGALGSKSWHMTFAEAAKLAKEADVSAMWLTHYSPSLVHPENYLKSVRKLFKNTELGEDGKSIELNFED